MKVNPELKAIQYVGGPKNLDLIIDNFGISPDEVSVNYATQSVKFGKCNGKRVKLNEWIVSYEGGIQIVEDSIVKNILSTVNK